MIFVRYLGVLGEVIIGYYKVVGGWNFKSRYIGVVGE